MIRIIAGMVFGVFFIAPLMYTGTNGIITTTISNLMKDVGSIVFDVILEAVRNSI